MGVRRPDSWVMKTAGVWLLVFAYVFLSSSILGYGLFGAERLAYDGRTTTGRVVELVPENHDGCRFTYAVAGRTYEDFDEGCGDSRQVGDPVTVTYVRSKPQVATTGPPLHDLIRAELFRLLVPSFIAFFIGLRLRRAATAEAPDRSRTA